MIVSKSSPDAISGGEDRKFSVRSGSRFEYGSWPPAPAGEAVSDHIAFYKSNRSFYRGESFTLISQELECRAFEESQGVVDGYGPCPESWDAVEHLDPDGKGALVYVFRNEGTNEEDETRMLKIKGLDASANYLVADFDTPITTMPLPTGSQLAEGYPVTLEPWTSKILKIINVAFDQDEDGRVDGQDNCPYVANPDQMDTDLDGDGLGEGIGDACRVVLPAFPTEDGRIVGGNVNSNASGANSLRVGDKPNGNVFKTILSFDTTGIPSDMQVEAAEVWLRRGSTFNNNPFGWPARGWLDIKQGYFGDSADLEEQDISAPASQDKAARVFDQPSSTGFVKTELDDDALQYIDAATGRVQFRFYVIPDSDNDHKRDTLHFYSGDSDSEDQPTVLIRYGDPSYY